MLMDLQIKKNHKRVQETVFCNMCRDTMECILERRGFTKLGKLNRHKLEQYTFHSLLFGINDINDRFQVFNSDTLQIIKRNITFKSLVSYLENYTFFNLCNDTLEERFTHNKISIRKL